MIRSQFNNLGPLTFLALAISLAACGGEEPEDSDNQSEPTIECATDTRLEDGQCVPDIGDNPCDDDRILSPAGACIDPALYCGDNTVYDSATGQCIDPAEISCGEGTIEVDGQCIVENPINCGDGTVLADGECLLSEDVCGDGTEFEAPYCNPSEDACQDGAQWDVVEGTCTHGGSPDCGENTVEVDSLCLPLLTYADELAAEADIDHSDNSAIVPSAAGEFIFTGTMDDALTHQFDLEATEGQWLRVEIYPRGLPAPGFDLEGDGNWRRSSVPGMANPASRTVVIPADDTYELTVTSSLSDHPDGVSIADSSWKYVGVVELIDAPTAVQWNPLNDALAADLRDTTDNLFEITTSGVDELVLTPDMLGDDVEEATIEIWESPTTFSERISLTPGQSFLVDATASELFVHVDAAAFYGPDADLEISAEEPITLQPGQFFEAEIFAEAGQTIAIEHANAEADSLDVAIFFQGELLDEIDDVLANNESSYFSSDHMRDWLYAEQGGFYTVRFINTGSSDRSNFLSQVRAVDGQVFELPEPPAEAEQFTAEFTGTYAPGNWPLVVVKTPSAAHIEVDQESASGSLYNRVYNSDREEIQSSFSDSFEITLPAAGTYYFYTRISSTAEDVTVNMTGQSLETILPGETLEIPFDNVSTFDALVGTINYDQSAAPDMRLLNPNGQPVFELLEINDGLVLAELFPGPGNYVLEIENSGDQPIIGFETDVDHVERFETLSSEQAFNETFERTAPLVAGDKEVLVMQAQASMALQLSALVAAEEEARLSVWNVGDREQLRDQTASEEVSVSIPNFNSGIYLVVVEAVTDLPAGYTLILDGLDINLVNVSSEPGAEIPDDGSTILTDGLSVTGCSEILDIEVSIDIEHFYRGDLEIDIVHPDGSTARIHDGSGGGTDDVVGTYPYPEDTGLEDGEELLDFVGKSGDGPWEIVIFDTFDDFSPPPQFLHSWGVSLSCAD